MFLMTKSELIDAVVARHPEDFPSKLCAERMFNSIIDVVTEELVRGNSVSICGFGTVKIAEHAEKTGLNPRNGEKIIIPARRAVIFRASDKLKNKLNS